MTLNLIRKVKQDSAAAHSDELYVHVSPDGQECLRRVFGSDVTFAPKIDGATTANVFRNGVPDVRHHRLGDLGIYSGLGGRPVSRFEGLAPWLPPDLPRAWEVMERKGVRLKACTKPAITTPNQGVRLKAQDLR